VLVAFLLGLTGSLGHCTGMCGDLALLLSRRGTTGWRLLLTHLGRVVTYCLLGLSAGVVGGALGLAVPNLRQLQGVLALLTAGVAAYLALSLMGRAPSPESLLVGLTQRWGRAMQHLTDRQGAFGFSFFIGMLWGLLPCGLVLTALLPAAVSASPLHGAHTMLAFGVGTSPALLGVGWLARRGLPRAKPFPRQVAALVVLLLGVQMALRGMAAWGWVSHLHLGGVMVW